MPLEGLRSGLPKTHPTLWASLPVSTEKWRGWSGIAPGKAHVSPRLLGVCAPRVPAALLLHAVLLLNYTHMCVCRLDCQSHGRILSCTPLTLRSQCQSRAETAFSSHCRYSVRETAPLTSAGRYPSLRYIVAYARHIVKWQSADGWGGSAWVSAYE